MSGTLLCPKDRAPLQDVEIFRGIHILTCPQCSGGFYAKSALTVKVQLDAPRQTQLACPGCGQTLRTGTMCEGKIELDQCEGCGGVWFDAAEVQRLRTLANVDGILSSKPGGDEEAPETPRGGGPPLVVTSKGVMPKSDWHDDNARVQDPDVRAAPRARLDGVDYQHYQSALARVTGAIGEFTWKVAVGEKARVRDFVAPPLILSNEVSGQDSVWSRGRYVKAQDVWAAFQLEGAPPPQTGVNPAQPDPYDDAWGPTLRALSFALVAAMALWGVLSAAKSGRVAYQGSFSYSSTDPEKSRVTPEFVLDGHASNVEIRTVTNLENRWFYLDYALINADTDEALDFGREISFYHGVDDGEYWSEGASYDEAVLRAVPPGRYYLRVEPEEGDAAAFNYAVTVKRDVVQLSPLLAAAGLLLLPLAFIGWRRWTFECARWRDSDHPWTSSGGDDSGGGSEDDD